MNNFVIDILIAIVSTTIINCIIFWYVFKNTIAKINKSIEENENLLKDTILKYENGYNPEHICETCYKGRYSYNRTVGFGQEMWFCDNCNAQAPYSWIAKRTKSNH